MFNFAQAELAPKAKQIDEEDDFKDRSVCKFTFNDENFA